MTHSALTWGRASKLWWLLHTLPDYLKIWRKIRVHEGKSECMLWYLVIWSFKDFMHHFRDCMKSHDVDDPSAFHVYTWCYLERLDRPVSILACSALNNKVNSCLGHDRGAWQVFDIKLGQVQFYIQPNLSIFIRIVGFSTGCSLCGLEGQSFLVVIIKA